MSLHVVGVDASYGQTDVLRSVDLVVPSGVVVALLGPNGAGKTTLLRCCSGLLPARRGRITLDGSDVTVASPHDLVARGLCHIPEGRAIFPSLTVEENLHLLADDAGSAPVEAAVEAFPVLAQKLAQRAGTMSGGEQQMLALARAYVTEPRFVLLDEVSMGLAPQVVDEIFDFLTRLVASGVALLVVEQYVAKALDLADLVYVMQRGSIVFAGESSELDADTIAESYLGSGSALDTPASASTEPTSAVS